MDQIIWTKLSGSSYLDQVIWIKLSGSRNQTLNSNYFARSQTSKVKILKYSIIFERSQTLNQIFKRNRKISKMFQEIWQLCDKQFRILWITRNFSRSKSVCIFPEQRPYVCITTWVSMEFWQQTSKCVYQA